jgi:hypothetical protein
MEVPLGNPMRDRRLLSTIPVMKYATVFATCAIGLTLSACGDDGDSSSYKGPPPSSVATTPANPAAATTPPAAGTAATTPVEGGAAAPVVPSSPNTDSTSLCKTVLANSWKSLQPALAMVGSEVAQPEADYLGNKFFIKKCSGLTAAQVDCLSKSEAPLTGIVECKINEGAKSSDKLRLPSFRKSREKPAELPAEEQAKLLKSVVGTWKNDFKSYKQVTRSVAAVKTSPMAARAGETIRLMIQADITESYVPAP